MKKTLRKIIPLMLLGATSLTTGCSMYHSKAADLSMIVGTYELTEYKSEHTLHEEEKYDRKADEEITAYFSIDVDGYAFYGYKDKETKPWIQSARANYTRDDKETEKYKAVQINNGIADVKDDEQKVGCMDESPMGFQYFEKKKEGIAGVFGKKELVCTLSYTFGGYENPFDHDHILYQYVCYTKISDETGLDKINKLMGTSITIDKPYELKRASGYYVYRCETKEESGIGNKNIYEYAILDMNVYSNGKARVIYSLAANPGQKTEEVEFTMGTIGYSMKSTILGSEFESQTLGLSFNTVFDETKDIKQESFTHYYSDTMTLEEIIASETAA